MRAAKEVGREKIVFVVDFSRSETSNGARGIESISSRARRSRRIKQVRDGIWERSYPGHPGPGDPAGDPKNTDAPGPSSRSWQGSLGGAVKGRRGAKGQCWEPAGTVSLEGGSSCRKYEKWPGYGEQNLAIRGTRAATAGTVGGRGHLRARGGLSSRNDPGRAPSARRCSAFDPPPCPICRASRPYLAGIELPLGQSSQFPFTGGCADSVSPHVLI